MPEALAETTRETVKLLFQNGLKLPIIEAETGVKQSTIRNWIYRYNWDAAAAEVTKILKNRQHKAVARSVTLAQTGSLQLARMPEIASSRLREQLSSEVASQMVALQSEPVKRASELANTREREGRASVVKRLVDSAAILEDWESQHTPGIVVMMESTQPAQESIDTGATVEMLPADPATEAIRALQED